MILLKELLDAAWDVTVLKLDLRKEDGELIQSYVIGEGCGPETATSYQRDDMKRGKLEMIDAKINHYGDIDKRGNWQTGWGPNLKAIPKDLLDAQVIHFMQYRGGGWESKGTEISAWICNTQLTLADVMEGGGQ